MDAKRDVRDLFICSLKAIADTDRHTRSLIIKKILLDDRAPACY